MSLFRTGAPSSPPLCGTHILKTLGSTVALASTHHPQSDGQSERAIQTLLRLLRCFAWNAMNGRGGWPETIPLIQFCHQQRPPPRPLAIPLSKSCMARRRSRRSTSSSAMKTTIAPSHGTWAMPRSTNSSGVGGKFASECGDFVVVHLEEAAKMMKRRYDSHHPLTRSGTGRPRASLRTRPPFCRRR